MDFQLGDRVVVVEDIFANADDSGCVGYLGTVVGFNNRIEVLLDKAPTPLGFDNFELELAK